MTRCFGMLAVLLLRLDARMGTWQDVAGLAQHFDVPLDFVLDTLEQLVADGLVRATRDATSGEITAVMVAEAGACA